MPSTAPTNALVVLLAAWNVASRKTEVSKPSRSTARNTIATRAIDVPLPSAFAAAPSSSRFMKRACVVIHSTIAVTKTTATRPMTVSMPSCWRCGRLCSTTFSVTPTPMLSATAAVTPYHIGRSEAPLRRRNVAMMDTTRTASRPSRRPITKVGSMRSLSSDGTGCPGVAATLS